MFCLPFSRRGPVLRPLSHIVGGEGRKPVLPDVQYRLWVITFSKPSTVLLW